MKNIFIASVCIAFMSAAAGCGTTTDKDLEGLDYKTADSAVGNTDAANKIYRDSGDIRSATQAGGGTANPAPSDSTTEGKQK